MEMLPSNPATAISPPEIAPESWSALVGRAVALLETAVDALGDAGFAVQQAMGIDVDLPDCAHMDLLGSLKAMDAVTEHSFNRVQSYTRDLNAELTAAVLRERGAA